MPDRHPTLALARLDSFVILLTFGHTPHPPTGVMVGVGVAVAVLGLATGLYIRHRRKQGKSVVPCARGQQADNGAVAVAVVEGGGADGGPSLREAPKN